MWPACPMALASPWQSSHLLIKREKYTLWPGQGHCYSTWTRCGRAALSAALGVAGGLPETLHWGVAPGSMHVTAVCDWAAVVSQRLLMSSFSWGHFSICLPALVFHREQAQSSGHEGHRTDPGDVYTVPTGPRVSWWTPLPPI